MGIGLTEILFQNLKVVKHQCVDFDEEVTREKEFRVNPLTRLETKIEKVPSFAHEGHCIEMLLLRIFLKVNFSFRRLIVQ